MASDNNNMSSSYSPAVLAAPVESVAGKHPVFAQTMLRITDPAASIAFYESLGLKYIATMAFPEYKFSLYFLVAPDSTTPEPPPIDSPRDVVSKFLWSIRCPTLELTHNWPSEGEAPEKFVSGNVPPYGYGHLALSGTSVPKDIEAVVADGSYGPSCEEKITTMVTDPDGYSVKIIDASSSSSGQKNATYARTMLRIHDPQKMVPFFERLGMTKLAVTHEKDAGISHYFMGYYSSNTDDIPTSMDEWVTNLQAPVVHLRHNWAKPEERLVNGNEKPHRGFGNLGIIVDDIYSLMKSMEQLGYGVVRKPSPFLDVGEIAFIKDDDMTGYWVEIIARSNQAADQPYVKT